MKYLPIQFHHKNYGLIANNVTLPVQNLAVDPRYKEDSYEYRACLHPEHDFPMMLYVPGGKIVTHICPGCGHKTTVKCIEIWF